MTEAGHTGKPDEKNEPKNDQRRSWRKIVAVATLPLLVGLIFAPAATFGLMPQFDDFAHVTANEELSLTWAHLLYWWTHPVVSIYMPVTMYSYMLDHWFWGLNPAGYHVQSLFWHALAAVMVFRCFRACGAGAGWAWLAAACWAIHPQRVESVAWISERKDVMCCAFYFWALSSYWRSDPTARFNGRVLALTVLALLCKPMAVSLPPVLMLSYWVRTRNHAWRDYAIRFLPYFLAMGVILALTFYFQVSTMPRTRDWHRQALVILHNFGWYSWQTLWPSGQRGIQPRVWFDAAVWLRLALFYGAAAALLLAAWRRVKRESMVYEWLPILAMYGVALLPVVGVFHLGFIDYADRYPYIPSFFLLLLIVRALDRVHWPRHTVRLAAAVGIAYGVWLAAASWNYLPEWRSYYQLLRHACSFPDVNSVALVDRGFLDLENGNYPAALAAADRLDAGLPADRGDDYYANTFYAGVFRAKVAYEAGNYHLAKAILVKIYPALQPKQYYKLGIPRFVLRMLIALRIRDGEIVPARRDIADLLQCFYPNEKTYEYYYYRGMDSVLAGDYATAAVHFREALRQKPGDRAATLNLQDALRECARPAAGVSK